MTNRETFELAKDRIVQGAEWMHRAVSDVQDRYERAADAGGALAADVYRFMEDPEGVGLDALREAWLAFMTQHSGNFGPPLAAAQ